MGKIRINELARELEVKPNRLLELLPEFGVTEKKTHSSSIDEDVALKLRHVFGFGPLDEERPEEGERAVQRLAVVVQAAHPLLLVEHVNRHPAFGQELAQPHRGVDFAVATCALSSRLCGFMPGVRCELESRDLHL